MIYGTIRGDCDNCYEKYCESRNHHELAWFLCRNPNKPNNPSLKIIVRDTKDGGKDVRKNGRKS